MIVWIIAAVAVLFIVLVFVTGYVKASPDTAYIISGLTQNAEGPHRQGGRQNTVF